MKVVASAFISGFAIAHAIGYWVASSRMEDIASAFGTRNILEGPPTAWYLALSLVEAAAAAWVYLAVSRHLGNTRGSATAIVSAAIAGAATSFLAVGLSRPIPPVVAGSVQLAVDIVSACAAAGILAAIIGTVLGKRNGNAI